MYAQHPLEGYIGIQQQYMHTGVAKQQQRGFRDFTPKPAGYAGAIPSRNFALRPAEYGQGQSQTHYPSRQPIFAATGHQEQVDFSQPTASTLGAVPENPDTIVQREAEGMIRAPPKQRKPNKSNKGADEVYSSRKRRLGNYCMKLNSFLNRRCFITEAKSMFALFNL
jgi:hypothetical protein